MKTKKITEIIKPMLSVIPVAIAIGLLAASIAIYNKITDNYDSPAEESIEELIEQEAEAVFFLEKGKLKGKIDLSPSSKEI